MNYIYRVRESDAYEFFEKGIFSEDDFNSADEFAKELYEESLETGYPSRFFVEKIPFGKNNIHKSEIVSSYGKRYND